MPALADWLIDQGDSRGEVIAGLLRADALDRTAFWRLFGLRPEHAAYLQKFSRTRRMKRDAIRAAEMPDPIREAVGLPMGPEGAYSWAVCGYWGDDRDESILDYNEPPKGQPGLWCQWVPDADGIAIKWSGGEKFYRYVQWLRYLIEHFHAPWGYILNGKMTWQGEENEDQGTIVVTDNVVETELVAEWQRRTMATTDALSARVSSVFRCFPGEPSPLLRRRPRPAQERIRSAPAPAGTAPARRRPASGATGRCSRPRNAPSIAAA